MPRRKKRKSLFREIEEVSDEGQKQAYEKVPEVAGEESISGSMPSPDSDDNTLDDVHRVGHYEDVDEEHPKKLGLGEEIDKDEKAQWEK